MELFKLSLDALQKSSDRTRSILYVFIIINSTILFAYINGTTFSLKQERLDTLHGIVGCYAELKVRVPPRTDPTDDCGEYWKTLASVWPGYSSSILKKPRFLSSSPPSDHQRGLEISVSEDLAIDILRARAIAVQQDLFSERNFQFPLFGISIDLDYLWLPAGLISILSLYILSASISTGWRDFDLAMQLAANNSTEKKLVLSTQVLCLEASVGVITSRSLRHVL